MKWGHFGVADIHAIPIITFPRFLFSLVSLAILAGAIYLAWSWYEGYDVLYRDGRIRHFRGESWRLYTAIRLGAWSFLGRFVVLMFIPAGKNDPSEERGQAGVVTAPDGSALHVETMGARGGSTIVLTHGWGLNATAWRYTKHALAARYRLMIWDLPGLGRSKPPKDGKFTIDGSQRRWAPWSALRDPCRCSWSAIAFGGMTTQTFWRACPQDLRQAVAGVVLIDTTHEDPLRTMWLSPLWRTLRWPVIEPMMWLTILLSPLVWLSSWQGYLSGSNQLVMRLTGFGRFATRNGRGCLSCLSARAPAPRNVGASGELAMFITTISDERNTPWLHRRQPDSAGRRRDTPANRATRSPF
ncbi:MAG: alpha/beta fold hydrolase [Caulobacteraceae bacterium]